MSESQKTHEAKEDIVEEKGMWTKPEDEATPDAGWGDDIVSTKPISNNTSQIGW